MDWDDLHTFLAVARHGSLSAAARALHVQQSTMSRRLEAMESRTGARLLQRTPAGYVLTEAGEAILGHVERIENEVLSIERTITGRDIRLEGEVRLTTVESLATHVLMPILASFQDRNPGIRIELILDQRSLSLARREADVAIRLARPTQHDLAVRKIADIENAIYAAPAYLDSHGQPDFTAGAPGHRAILPPADAAPGIGAAWFAAITGQAAVPVRVSERTTQRAAAAAGMGLVFLPRFIGDGPDLVRLPAPPPPCPPLPHREMWLAVHSDTRHTPRIRAITDFIAAAMRAEAPRLAPGGPIGGRGGGAYEIGSA